MGINPPVDREEAVSRPTYVYQDKIHGVEIRMGPEKEGPDNFRYVVLFSGATKREVWHGYLYKEEQ
jgi:hypothetical protein